MSKPYYRLDPYAKPRPVIEWDETYDMLRGPDGFECLLTEPEDRTWFRDGRNVVAKLNEQHAEIERLRKALAEVLVETNFISLQAARSYIAEVLEEVRQDSP